MRWLGIWRSALAINFLERWITGGLGTIPIFISIPPQPTRILFWPLSRGDSGVARLGNLRFTKPAWKTAVPKASRRLRCLCRQLPAASLGFDGRIISAKKAKETDIRHSGTIEPPD